MTEKGFSSFSGFFKNHKKTKDMDLERYEISQPTTRQPSKEQINDS